METRGNLDKKWWHRLLKVLFFFSFLIVLIISFLLALSSVALNKNNVNVITSLNDFTSSMGDNSSNSIPPFIGSRGSLGCYDGKNGNIEYVSEYELQNSFCSINLLSRTDEAARFFNSKYPEANYTTYDLINNIFEYNKNNNKDNKKYCFITKDLDCSIKSIVKYEKNWVFYIEALFYAFLSATIWTILWSLFYYKVFLYILYGNKKKIND